MNRKNNNLAFFALFVVGLHSSLNKLAMFLLMLTLLAGLNVIEAAAQTSELKLQSKQNGFTGEHTSGNTKLFVKYQAVTADSTISRIQNSNKQTLVESIREKDVITVKINDVTITYYMDAKNPEKSKASELSDADTQKLRKFSLSEESASVRKLIAELIRQKAGTEVGQLKGFVTIAMILGDGPGAPEELQSNANCKSPKLIQMYASYRPQSQPKVQPSNVANKTSAVVGGCQGCCGPSCWGCTGCWTGACDAHDTCVEIWGYTSSNCMGLLAVAVASMHYQCGM